MGFIRSVNLLLLGLLVPLGQVISAPTAEGESTILARDYRNYTDCSVAQRNKINRAFQDAAVMARQVAQNHGSQTFTSSPAYKHYFRDDQHTIVGNMFAVIARQWEPPAPNSHQSGAGQSVMLNQFKVSITCQDAPICSGSGTKSLVITDLRPGNNTFIPRMRFCPQFFKPQEMSTSRNLDSLPYKLNPGRRDESWCKPGYKFRDFEVSGTTVIHEITHLDEAGLSAGLTRRRIEGQNFYSAGAEDIYTERGYSSDPPTAARQLHKNWIEALRTRPPRNPPPYPETVNAESYAASVTEWWFMSKCNLQEISL
ncbi:hypothetical protein F4806DRAFT_497718 [Annulohypoxylon nitens]|nr:hypothetical protein F4806DRAFT_497718 [Annulohypoxylon nitens]